MGNSSRARILPIFAHHCITNISWIFFIDLRRIRYGRISQNCRCCSFFDGASKRNYGSSSSKLLPEEEWVSDTHFATNSEKSSVCLFTKTILTSMWPLFQDLSSFWVGPSFSSQPPTSYLTSLQYLFAEQWAYHHLMGTGKWGVRIQWVISPILVATSFHKAPSQTAAHLVLKTTLWSKQSRYSYPYFTRWGNVIQRGKWLIQGHKAHVRQM